MTAMLFDSAKTGHKSLEKQRKSPKPIGFKAFFVAAEEGFEPSQTESETDCREPKNLAAQALQDF